MSADLARQVLYGVLYYALLVLVLRQAGKRLAVRKLGIASPEEVELAVERCDDQPAVPGNGITP